MADFLRWHRLFGIALTDLFTDTPWRVELEKELALSSQLLDVAIIARTAEMAGPGAAAAELPDGLDDLRPHNLLTFKSRHEALSAWALDELVGHYVNYRKAMRVGDRMLPETAFGLYAVAVRAPQDLADAVALRKTAWAGVFDIPWGMRHIRLVVPSEIERHPRNAVWSLFSARAERVAEAARQYRPRRRGVLELLRSLYLAYALESDMPYTMEEFIREAREEMRRTMTPEERQSLLAGMPVEERLRGINPEEVLKGFGPEDRLRGLTPEELRRLRDYLNTLN